MRIVTKKVPRGSKEIDNWITQFMYKHIWEQDVQKKLCSFRQLLVMKFAEDF